MPRSVVVDTTKRTVQRSRRIARKLEFQSNDQPAEELHSQNVPEPVIPDIPTKEEPSQMSQEPVSDSPLELQQPRHSGRLRRPPRRYIEEC